MNNNTMRLQMDTKRLHELEREFENARSTYRDSIRPKTGEEIIAAFPDIDPGFEPLGSRVIVQLRTPKEMVGTLHLPDEVIDLEMWNTQIGKVRAIGPCAFRRRDNGDPWPEGSWFKIGDYVRIPKFNQDKWYIEIDYKRKDMLNRDIDGKKMILFMLINDLDVLAIKTGNPLDVKSYL